MVVVVRLCLVVFGCAWLCLCMVVGVRGCGRAWMVLRGCMAPKWVHHWSIRIMGRRSRSIVRVHFWEKPSSEVGSFSVTKESTPDENSGKTALLQFNIRASVNLPDSWSSSTWVGRSLLCSCIMIETQVVGVVVEVVLIRFDVVGKRLRRPCIMMVLECE